MHHDRGLIICVFITMILVIRNCLVHGRTSQRLRSFVENTDREAFTDSIDKSNNQEIHLRSANGINADLYSINRLKATTIDALPRVGRRSETASTSVHLMPTSDQGSRKSKPTDSMIALPFTTENTSFQDRAVVWDDIGTQTDDRDNGVQQSSGSTSQRTRTLFPVNKRDSRLRKRDTRTVKEKKEKSTNERSDPSLIYSESVSLSPQTKAEIETTLPSRGRDSCFNFVSCVQPYISYVAGTIMFILVIYLIIVFGRCVCDETF